MPKVLSLPLFDQVVNDPEASAPSGPPDTAARTEALDIRRSFIVEAPAGSGKTGLLIQRYLKLLADESVTTPEQVLAITFTLKATAEMRDRVFAHLEAAHLDTALGHIAAPAPNDFARQTRSLARAVLERDRRLGWDLLDSPRRLNLRTIDSVCAEIARTLPILSGSGGHLAPTADAAPLHREAARRTLLLLGTGDTALDAALRDLLLHRDGNLADCETLLADMLSLRDQWGDLIWGELIWPNPGSLNPASLDDAYLDAHVLPRLQAALEHAICAGLSELAQAFPADVLQDLTELAAEMAQADGHDGAQSPIALCKGKHRSPEMLSDDLEHWRALIHLIVKPSKPRDWRKGLSPKVLRFAIAKHQESRLKHIISRLSDRPELVEILCSVNSLPPARYPANQWAVAKSLFRVLSRTLIELQLVFAQHNQCDFTELSLLARHALSTGAGPEDLAAALGARLQHLLVDEMQDTSASQYSLIQRLTASWDGHSQTVFLVGDPRQSIYLFRQARVERFLSTMRTRLLGDLPLTRLRLTANFRSQQRLVDQFNTTFGLIFPTEATPSAPTADSLPYTAADSVLPSSPHAVGLAWHANPVPIRPTSPSFPVLRPGSLLPTPAQMRRRQARLDAKEIRTIAAHWLAKPLPATRPTIRLESGAVVPEPWRIAVLVRSRSHLSEIVTALKTGDQAGDDAGNRIPFRAVEIDSLTDRQEVLDLTALTRALLHPADRTAWLAVLRAPWCGLPLADLHTLAAGDDPTLRKQSIQRMIAERNHLLSAESRQRVARVAAVLQHAATQRTRVPIAQLVERTWLSLGGDAALTPSELTNARRFFQLLDQLEAESPSTGIDTRVLGERLKFLFAEPDLIPPDQPSIELLTIHRAKGLEWDVVIVPALERSPGFSRTRLLTWSELDTAEDDDSAAHILLAPIAARGEEVDDLTKWLKNIYKQREAAERKRLFYVACTRAREELHLFAAPDITARGDLSMRWDSLLKAVWPAAKTPVETAYENLTTAPARSLRAKIALSSESDIRIIGTPQPAILDLAAAVESPSQPNRLARPPIHRLPLAFDPAARFAAARARKLPYAGPEADTLINPAQFSRPEGSFAARSFGNAVHALLETLATRIAAGSQPPALLAELPRWIPRIAAILRADGLPPATVDRLTRETRSALENTLRDPDGLWLLAPHTNAANELALTAWDNSAGPNQPVSIRPVSIRIDRIFNAGPTPRATPDPNFLWIVDYKTASHGLSGLDDFLASQRAAYAPQLEAYARVLAPAQNKSLSEVRLALYYPTIPRLIWWTPDH